MFNGDGNWFRGTSRGPVWRLVPRSYDDDLLTGFGGDFLDFRARRGHRPDARRFRSVATTSRTRAPTIRSLYVGDTFSLDRLTINGSLRFDRATIRSLAATVPAHPVCPTSFPASSAPAVHDAVVWNTLAPRIGATFALDSKHKTQLRGSYPAFASQLNVTTASTVSAAGYAYAYYLAVDANHNPTSSSTSSVASSPRRHPSGRSAAGRQSDCADSELAAHARSRDRVGPRAVAELRAVCVSTAGAGTTT